MGSARAGALTGPQQVTSFPLGQNASPFLPVPPLPSHFHVGCWATAASLPIIGEGRFPGSPPCPQLFFLKHGIHSFCLKTVKQLKSSEKEIGQGQNRGVTKFSADDFSGCLKGSVWGDLPPSTSVWSRGPPHSPCWL